MSRLATEYTMVHDGMAVATRKHVYLDGVSAVAQGDAQSGQGVLRRDSAPAPMGHHQGRWHYFTPVVSAVGVRWRWRKTKPMRMGTMTKTSAAMT